MPLTSISGRQAPSHKVLNFSLPVHGIFLGNSSVGWSLDFCICWSPCVAFSMRRHSRGHLKMQFDHAYRKWWLGAEVDKKSSKDTGEATLGRHLYSLQIFHVSFCVIGFNKRN